MHESSSGFQTRRGVGEKGEASSTAPGAPHLSSQFELVLRHTPIVLWSVDAQGIFTRSEGSALARLGLRDNEIVGRCHFDLYADAPEAVAFLRRALAGETFTAESKVGPVWFSTHYIPERDAQEQVIGAVCVSTDITSQVQSRLALEEAVTHLHQMASDRKALDSAIENERENFRNLFRQTSEMVCILRGPDHVFEFVNEAHVRTLGFDATGLTVRAAQPESVEVHGLLDEVYRTGVTAHLREIPVTVTDRVRWFDLTYAARRDNGGRINGVMILGSEITDQIKGRDRLKESELRERAHAEKLTLITNAIPDLISYVNADERYEFVNSAYEHWFGIKATDAIGRPMAEVIGKNYATSRPFIEKALRGEPSRFEAQVPGGDGPQRALDARYIPDLDAGGDVRGFVVVAHDITELRAARDSAQNQLKWLEMVLNKIQTGIVLIEPESEAIRFANETAHALTGGVSTTLDGYRDRAFVTDAQGQRLPESQWPRSLVCRGEQFRDMEATWHTSAGSVDVLLNSALLPPIYGMPRMALLSFLDVTTLKKTERELRQKSEAIENSLNGFDIVDARGRFIYANPTYVRMWGYASLDEVIQSSPQDHCADPGVPRQIISTLKEKGECRIEFKAKRKDGTLFDVLMWARLAHDSSGAEIYPTTSIDISDLKSALRARDDFLSIASHELKTPLTSLKLQAQIQRRLMSKGDPTALAPERVDALVDQTEKQVSRLTRLVDDMLDVSRIQSGHLHLASETFDFGEMAEEVVERLAGQFRNAGAPVPRVTRTGDLVGRWDRMRLEQVLINLLTNALRYGLNRPVSVSVRGDGAGVVASVSDQGYGIAKGSQATIFERFERAISADEVSGLGLGLFITKQIVEAHQGRIWVESDLGHGSVFHVALPKEGGLGAPGPTSVNSAQGASG